MKKQVIGKIILSIILIGVYGLLFRIYRMKIAAFGCTDECFNYMAGYFINHGKILYSQIFFNHQLIPAYLSAIIQQFTRPINIYDLLLKHRMFVVGYGLLFSLLLTWRFGIVGVGFALIYEFSKFYLFGDRFLGESLTVYPLVYLAGLVHEKTFNHGAEYFFDYILAAIFGWLVIFTREPYTISAVFLLIVIWWGSVNRRWKLVFVVCFGILCCLTILSQPINDYIFNLYSVNAASVMGQELDSYGIHGLLISFFYPWYLFFVGQSSIYRIILIGISVVFNIGLIFLFFNKRNWRYPIFIFLMLGLANLRPGIPGKMYFEAFHMINWYGLFIIITLLLVKTIWKLNRGVGIFLVVLLSGTFVRLIAGGDAFIHDKTDPQADLLTNYGHYIQMGEVVRILSNRGDTFFADGSEELLYFQADRMSNYKYVWYLSAMPAFTKYTRARMEMFNNYPPDFYFGSCQQDLTMIYSMPPEAKDKYLRLLENGKPSCLYVSKVKAIKITPKQWQKAKDWFYGV